MGQEIVTVVGGAHVIISVANDDSHVVMMPRPTEHTMVELGHAPI